MNELQENWEEKYLYDLAEWTNGFAFKEKHFSITKDGKAIIKIAEIKGGLSGQTNYSIQNFPAKYAVTEGDILFCWSGSPETSIDTFIWHGKDGWLNQHIFKVEPKNTVDERFFYYILKFLKGTFIEIAKNKQTTGLGHVTIRDLKELRVFLPPLQIQRRIGQILGRLDDKIEVNRRINATLEAMAQAFYKHWFVDFGPFQDGNFVESELGLIPEGWRVGKLGELANTSKEVVRPEQISSDTPYIGLSDMPKGSLVLDHWGAAEDSISTKSKMRSGDILFGKLRPYFKKVGIAPFDGICSTDIYIVTPKYHFVYGFVLCTLIQQEFIDYTDSVSDGTRMPRVNWTMMARYPIPIPPTKVLERFNQYLDAWLKVIPNNILESRQLAATRDYLLPKLLSGGITVEVAEELVRV